MSTRRVVPSDGYDSSRCAERFSPPSMLVPFKSRQVSPREKREGDDDDGGGRKSEAEKGSLGEDPSARVFTVSDDDESLVRWSPQVDLI